MGVLRPRHGLILLLGLGVMGMAGAQTLPERSALLERASGSDGVSERAPGLLRGLFTSPMSRLDAAETGSISAMLQRNAEEPFPLQNGFSRSLNEPIRVDFSRIHESAASAMPAGQVARLDKDRLVWAGTLRVDSSHAFRIHLGEVSLPEDSKIWVYPTDDPELQLGPFGLELQHEREIWLPALNGPEFAIEVVLPTAVLTDDSFGFTIDRVVEIFDLAALRDDPRFGASWQGCALDALCFPTQNGNTLREATARLTFIEFGNSFLCSGGIINDTVAGSNIPYLLTANHCFDTQATASTLTAFFDYYRLGCQVGAVPSLGAVPQVSGSQLLATAVNSDHTLVRLTAEPPTEYVLLGWTATDPGDGAILDRMSHPSGSHMRFSQHEVDLPPVFQCTGSFDPAFNHYSTTTGGATVVGSSGAPVVNSSGQIVGQLLGICGNGNDRCVYGN